MQGRGQASAAVRFYLPFVIWLYPPPPLGSTHSCCALSSVVVLCPPSLGSALCRYVPSMGAMPCCWGVGGWYAWLLGGTCHRWGVCVEGRAKVNHNLRRGSSCQHRVPTVMVGLDISAGGWEERLEETNTMKVVFIFVTHQASPPCLSLPKSCIERERAAHNPLERGGRVCVCAGWGRWWLQHGWLCWPWVEGRSVE